jgi:hypothetical protein
LIQDAFGVSAFKARFKKHGSSLVSSNYIFEAVPFKATPSKKKSPLLKMQIGQNNKSNHLLN